MAKEQKKAEIINLGAKRAEKSDSSKDWTPKDCVETFLNDINRGDIKPTKVYILYQEEGSDKETVRHGEYFSHMSHMEHIVLLEDAKLQALLRNRC